MALLESIVASPETNVSRLAMLWPLEREELVAGLNATDRAYPENRPSWI